MKFLKIALATVLLALVAGGITLFVQMDALVKAAIENVGPRMTLTSVKVDSVHISPFSGTGRIHKLEIGNPRGFQSEAALKLKNIRISLVPRSLTAEKMIIREFIVEGPEITYEVTPSGNNLQKIQNNVNSFVPASKSEGRTSKGAEKKLEIDRFVLREAKVHVRSHVIGNQELDVNLPEIELKDLGKGPNGATVKEVSSAVLSAITHNVVTAVTSSGALKNVQGTLKSAQGTLQKGLKGLLGR